LFEPESREKYEETFYGVKPPNPQRFWRLNFTTFEEFKQYFEENFRYWLKPFIVLHFYDKCIILKDKGIRYRAFINSKRIELAFIILNVLYKRHLKIKAIKKKDKTIYKSKHIFITITIPHDVPWFEAFKLITKRYRGIISYFNRNFKVKHYLGALELHEDGYPHLHTLLILERPIRIFKHNNMFRFEPKRKWDKDLKSEEKGFIDCFALKNPYEISQYLNKYTKKTLKSVEKLIKNEKPSNKDYLLVTSRYMQKRVVLMDRKLRRLVKLFEKISLKFGNITKLWRAGLKKEVSQIIKHVLAMKKYGEIYDLISISPNCSQDDRLSKETPLVLDTDLTIWVDPDVFDCFILGYNYEIKESDES